MAGKRGGGKTTTMTGADWQRLLRIIDKVYADYLSGMVALRKRVVGDVKRKLSDGEVLDRPDLGPSSPRERPTSAARHRRARGRRSRASGRGRKESCLGLDTRPSALTGQPYRRPP